MQKLTLVFLSGLYATVAFAQDGVAIEKRSSNPQGLQIQESGKVNIGVQNTNLVSTGESSMGKNFVPSTRPEIKTNAKTGAQAKDLHTVSIDQSNAINNNIGTIGGK